MTFEERKKQLEEKLNTQKKKELKIEKQGKKIILTKETNNTKQGFNSPCI